ncbi:MAG TPA: hypothetical protein VII91_00635 [Bauldia sp.]
MAGAAPLALVGARFSALRTWLTIIFEREMERGRGFLWLPVLFSLGVLIYFVLPREPSRFAPVALVAALAIVAWLRRHRTVAFRIFLSAAAVAAGLCGQNPHRSGRRTHPVAPDYDDADRVGRQRGRVAPWR